MNNQAKQLNPFEIKSLLIKILSNINSMADIQNSLPDIELLDEQGDKAFLAKLLFKELVGASNEKIPVICFLLEHFLPKDSLISGLWEILKNRSLRTDVRVMVLNILRELDADWSYEDCSQFIDDADNILDENTKQLLNSAVINPEVQIDFMDFMSSISTDDKITLINSFENDFNQDALANILIPVFESNPSSPEGREALKLLGHAKSPIALHVLEKMAGITSGELNQNIRKSLATLKMSGIREDNSVELYKKILSNSKPDKFYITYPDALGNSAMIFTRLTEEERIRFVSVVINIDYGIKDCFGFFDISRFECDKIIEKFLKNEKVVNVNPSVFKNILYNAEVSTIKANGNEWKLPYEYVCWKNLLVDIPCENEQISDIVSNNISTIGLQGNIIEKLSEMKISAHWFLDSGYSEEFSNLLKDLKEEKNLDRIVNAHISSVFNNEEMLIWKNKLIFCAYIKYSIGKIDEAQEIYSLSQNELLFNKFLIEILKRSIYEYLILIKYNKDMNKEMFTDEDISFRIEYIEKNWVKSDV